jgi:hypothetical protein
VHLSSRLGPRGLIMVSSLPKQYKLATRVSHCSSCRRQVAPHVVTGQPCLRAQPCVSEQPARRLACRGMVSLHACLAAWVLLLLLLTTWWHLRSINPGWAACLLLDLLLDRISLFGPMQGGGAKKKLTYTMLKKWPGPRRGPSLPPQQGGLAPPGRPSACVM